MIEIDIALQPLTEGDIQETAGRAVVRARLNKTPSGQWLTCFATLLKGSASGLLSGDPPKYDFLERRQPVLAFGVSKGAALSKLKVITELVNQTNATAAQMNEQTATEQRLELDRAAQQRADFEEIKRELLTKR